ncbi:MAG: hypothetical protein H7343_21235 [Undibacterium sp.]|nr:hypothetical protein [Opitutaceae bacterium]
MNTLIRFCRVGVLFIALFTAARAQLVAPPEFTAITVPATALVGQTVTIGATAQATASDNSDGNDWNTPSRLSILRIIINVQAPDGSSSNVHDWLPAFTSPASASASVMLNQAGTWYVTFTAMDGRPWYNGVGPYAITVSTPPPGPVITSALGVSVNQGQNVSYQIGAVNGPVTAYNASSLPAGLSVNTSTGLVSGRITASANVNSWISVANANGSDVKQLIWYVTAANITPTGSVAAVVTNLGQAVTLNRGGTANFGVAFTDGAIWRPNGSSLSVGIQSLGSSSYVPDGGVGTYAYQYRLVDSYTNYADQWITFYVGDVNPVTVTTSAGQTFDGPTTNPSISFGQSVTVNFTANDPSGQMGATGINGYKGDGALVEYGPWAYFSPRSTYSYALTYQPASVGSGNHWMSNYGWTNGWLKRGFTLIVNKATPTGTFAARSVAPDATGTYAVAAGALNATFANPFSTAVAAPTGGATYRFTGTTTAVTVGTTLAAGTVRLIDAVYPGDANYLTTVRAAPFTVLGPTPPTAFQAGTLGSTFVALNWAASTSANGIGVYQVFRFLTSNGPATASLIGQTTATTFTDSTATPGTPYTYTVRAVDNSAPAYVSAVATLTATTFASFELFTPAP